jgi:hypothetical protein
MNGRITWILSLMLLAGASAAAAQRIDTPYRFHEEKQAAGLFVGYINTDPGSVGLGPESGMAFGARYHIQLSGPFYAEAEALYFPTTRAVLDTAVVDSAFQQIGEADVAIAMLQASLRFQITGQRTWNGILPFILLGAGIAVEAQGDDEAESVIPAEARFDFGTTFAGQLGAGIEFFPAKALSIRIDARNILWQLKTPEPLQLRDIGRTLPSEEWNNNITASVGVSIHF